MSTLVKDYDRFAKEAQAICKDRVYTDRLRRYAYGCLLYTSPSPRDRSLSRMPSSA